MIVNTRNNWMELSKWWNFHSIEIIKVFIKLLKLLNSQILEIIEFLSVQQMTRNHCYERASTQRSLINVYKQQKLQYMLLCYWKQFLSLSLSDYHLLQHFLSFARNMITSTLYKKRHRISMKEILSSILIRFIFARILLWKASNFPRTRIK